MKKNQQVLWSGEHVRLVLKTTDNSRGSLTVAVRRSRRVRGDSWCSLLKADVRGKDLAEYGTTIVEHVQAIDGRCGDGWTLAEKNMFEWGLKVLAPDGYCCVTVHGRYTKAKGLSDALTKVVEAKEAKHALRNVAAQLIEHGQSAQPVEEQRLLPFGSD